MANKIVQAYYSLKDGVSAGLQKISDAWKGAGDAADKASTRAETANKRLSASYKQSAEGVNQLREALIVVAEFAGLEKIAEGLKSVVEAGEQFEGLKTKFAAAFGGLEQGSEALEKVREIAKATPDSFEDVAAAAIKLRQAGIDPLGGALQALIDNQTALGQSQDQLLATIDALGKANERGGVNLKSLVSLTQEGIPVFDLLGTALGVSADRVRELANTGQLGSDSIKLLITQLGNLRAGASTTGLDKTESQITKLKDAAREFLEEIAGSGALDVFRTNLKSLNAEIEEAAQSGKLKELAQSISDGIVSTASAIKSAIGFVIDYSGALTRLGAALLTIKAINIGSSLLSGASAMITAGNAAKTAAAGAETATGFFGKLGTAVRSIPSALKLSVAAFGIDLVLEGLAKIYELYEQNVEIQQKLGALDVQNEESQKRLQAAIADTLSVYKQFANVAVESGDQLKAQSRDQLKAYADQLDGAKKYYSALVVQANAAHDAVALKGAHESLDAVTAAIVAVNAQLALTKAAGKDAVTGLTDGMTEFQTKLAELGTDAKAIGEFIAKAFEKFDLRGNVTEVGDFAVALDTLAAKGGRVAQILDTTLLESLKKLSGQDLLQFQSDATAAIDAVGKEGEKTSETLKATLETALDRLGVKAQDTGVKITKSGADIIASFTAVAENAQATSKTIVAAFDAAIINAKTVDEVKALGDELTSVGKQGKVSLADLADAGRVLDERIRTITANLSPLASQFQVLGIKSQAQLDAVKDNAKEAFDAIYQGALKGTAAQEDVTRAFQAYVTASRAATADSQQWQKDTNEEQLAVLASSLGLTDQFKAMGDAAKKAGDTTKDAFGNAKDAIDAADEAAGNLKNKLDDAGDSTSKVGDSAAKSAGQVQQAMGGVIAITEEASNALTFMNNILDRQGTLANVSLEDAKFLLTNLGALAGAQAEILTKRIEDLTAAAEKAKQVADKMADEASSLQDEIDQINGNDTSIEDRRHTQKLADLKAEAEADGQLNSAAYKHLIDLENQLHVLKMANIKKQQDAAKTDSGSGSNSNASGSSDSNGRPGSGALTSTIVQPVELHVHLDGAVIVGSQVDKAAEQFARPILKQLQAIQQRSIGNILTNRN